MKTKTIEQTIMFKATQQEIYEILMDSRKHSAATGMKAKISREIGGKLSAGGGYISGENVKLVQDKKIVQKWRGDDWPEGHFSLATFEFGKTKGGTKITLTQKDVPAEQYDNVSEGWYEFYWNPIGKWLGRGAKKNKASKEKA